MRQFQDLTLTEILKMSELANEYYAKHTSHVNRLYKTCKHLGVSPSGSDLMKPELWKGVHWRWYSNRFSNKSVSRNLELSEIFRTEEKDATFWVGVPLILVMLVLFGLYLRFYNPRL